MCRQGPYYLDHFDADPSGPSASSQVRHKNLKVLQVFVRDPVCSIGLLVALPVMRDSSYTGPLIL